MKKTKTNVTLRLPLTVIERVQRVAKLAGVTPTQVYVVLLAFHMEAQRDADRASHAGARSNG